MKPFIQTTSARHEFSEEAIWRNVLGNSAQLLIMSTYGPLDAPDYVPCGSTGTIPISRG